MSEPKQRNKHGLSFFHSLVHSPLSLYLFALIFFFPFRNPVWVSFLYWCFFFDKYITLWLWILFHHLHIHILREFHYSGICISRVKSYCLESCMAHGRSETQCFFCRTCALSALSLPLPTHTKEKKKRKEKDELLVLFYSYFFFLFFSPLLSFFPPWLKMSGPFC